MLKYNITEDVQQLFPIPLQCRDNYINTAGEEERHIVTNVFELKALKASPQGHRKEHQQAETMIYYG
jgi:hypothetical protein